ncbi:MAG: adenylate kinase family protein [Candidatus Micrarchaeia archaeon]
MASRAKKTGGKLIALTGVPGTGKTSVAAELGRLGFHVVDLNALARGAGLVLSHDDADGSDEIDIDMLGKIASAIAPLLGPYAVFEGHLACEFPIPGAVAIVLRADPDAVRQRLGKRGYSKSKISKNAMSEMLDYCVIRARANYKKVFELDTTDASAAEIAQEIAAANFSKFSSDKVDWSRKLLDLDVREIVARKLAKI